MTIEILFVLCIGLAFGSFVTLASWRLPRGEEIVRTPSHCTDCSAQLTARDLWPLLSWAAFGAKCRHCHKAISIRYPLIEIATATLFLILYLRYGITLQAGMLALFGVALLIMIAVDFEHSIIPDQIHVVLLPLGLAYHYVLRTPWENVLYGFLAGAATGLLLHHGYRFLRKKEGLGYGDVKFFAVAGVWLTISLFVPFLFYSGVFGILTGLLWRLLKKGPAFPFGPSLALALLFCVVFPEYANLIELAEQSLR